MRLITFCRALACLAALALAAGAAAADSEFEAAVIAYEAGDYAAAHQAWLALASRGDPAAERNIGHLYRNGLGVAQDFAKAAEWYRRAAEKGLARAQANLGNMYLRGQDVPQDAVEATAWFERAARQGHVISQYNLGLLYETGLGVAADEALALGWYHLAAKAGHRRSLERLSVLVARGVRPAEVEEGVVSRDDMQGGATEEPPEGDRETVGAAEAPASPVEWATPAPGPAPGPTPGPTTDEEESAAGDAAVEWMPVVEEQVEDRAEIATTAEAGPKADEELTSHADTLAAPPVEWFSGPIRPEADDTLATPPVEWFSDPIRPEAAAAAPAPRSAPQAAPDDRFARLSDEDRLATGLDAYRDRDYAEAVTAWRPLAEGGDADAQFYLGGLYYEGAGVPDDVGLAFFWWSLAAEGGHAKADELRELAERELSGEDRDAILRRAETWQPTRPEPPPARPAAATPPRSPPMTLARAAAARARVGRANSAGATPTPRGEARGSPLAVADASASPLDAGLAAYRRQDFETAITAWLPLAVDGDRMAQFYVGGLYFDGTGVSASRVQAHLWWSLAAAQGLEMAHQLLVLLATEMSPTELAQALYLADSWSATE